MTTFTAELQAHGRTATGIEVPAEVVESLGAGKKPSVSVQLTRPTGNPGGDPAGNPGNGPGGYTYRTTVAPRGGTFLIPVSAEVRAAAGVSAGDLLDVEITLDTAPRTVTVPAELAEGLAADPTAQQFFDRLSYSHQRAYTMWIEDAKKPETKAARVSRALEMLHEGKKRS